MMKAAVMRVSRTFMWPAVLELVHTKCDNQCHGRALMDFSWLECLSFSRFSSVDTQMN